MDTSDMTPGHWLAIAIIVIVGCAVLWYVDREPADFPIDLGPQTPGAVPPSAEEANRMQTGIDEQEIHW